MASGSTVDPRLSFNLPSDASSWPSSILLAGEAYVAASRNDTTATARCWVDHTVEVTFWITDADPPAASFFTFYCTKQAHNSDSEEAVPEKAAQVAGTEGRFVLLRVNLDGHHGHEYFIYKGHPESPSLERVPYRHGMTALELAIVPGGDDGHYLLIDLCNDRDRMGNYRLHIYSSEDATWRSKVLRNPCPGGHTVGPDKVFVIRDGLLLWVSLLGGMLLCDVLQEPLRAQYIPLPEPLLGNRERVKEICRGIRRIRDVTCADGMIKFIEMEHREIEITDSVPLEKPMDPKTKDVLYDSDLITLMKRKPVEPKIRTERLQNGWSAMTWTRKIGSKCWLKGHIVDSDDILVDDSAFSELLSRSSQRSEPESDGSLTFKNLRSTSPTLSADGNDILYLISHAEYAKSGGAAALVAVDLAEKTLIVEAPGPHPFGKHFVFHSREKWRPCALANHLKITPGIKVSASQIARTGSSAKKEEITNKQTEKASYSAATSNSANEPNKTAIGVGEPDSNESDNKRPRLAFYSVH